MNAYSLHGKRCADPSHWPQWIPLTGESNASLPVPPQPPSSTLSTNATSSPGIDEHSREACMNALLQYVTQWMAILPSGVSSGTEAALHGAGIATGTFSMNATDSACASLSVQPVAMLNAMLVSLPTAVAAPPVQGRQQGAASPPRPEEAAEPGSSLTSTKVPELTPIIEDTPARPPQLLDVAAQLLRHSKWLASGLSHAAGPAPRLPSSALVSHAYQHALLAACSSDWVMQFRRAYKAGTATDSTTTAKADARGLSAPLPWTLPPAVLVESSTSGYVMQPIEGYRGTLVLLLFHPLRVVRVWARDVLLRLMTCTAPQHEASAPGESSSDGGERALATLLSFSLRLLCTLKHVSVLPAQVSFISLHEHPSWTASAAPERHVDAVKYVMQDRIHTVVDGIFHLLTVLTAWDMHFGKAVEALTMTSTATVDRASATSMPILLGKCRATVLLLGGSLVLYGLQGLHQGIHRALLEAWRDQQHRHPRSSSARGDLFCASQAAMTQLLGPLNTLLSSNPRMPRANAVAATAIRKALAKVLVHCLLDNASGLASSKEEEAWRRARLEWLWMFAAALEPPTPRAAAPLLADGPNASAPSSADHTGTAAPEHQGSGTTKATGQDDVGTGTLVWVPERCAGWLLRPLLKNAAQQFQWAKAMVAAKAKPSAGGAATASDGTDSAIAVLDKAVYGVSMLLDSLATALPRLVRSTYLHDTLVAHESQLLTLAIGGIVHTRSTHALRLHRLLFHADVHAFAAGAAAQGRGGTAPAGTLGVPSVCLQRLWLTLPTLIVQVCKSGAVSPADCGGHAGSAISGGPLPLSEVVASLCGALTVLAEEDAMPCPQWLFMSPAKVMSRAPPPFQWVVQRCLRTLAGTLQEQQELLKRVWLRLPSAPTEAAYASAAAAAASRALTQERPLLRLLFALRVAAAEDAEAGKLAERLTAVFCVGVTSSVSRTLSTEAAMWVWRRVVVTQPELRLHPPPPSTASTAAAAAAAGDGAYAAWDMNDAVVTSTARAQGHRWLVLLCACHFDQMSEWEVQCGWWMAALLADVVTLDVEQRRALAEQVILALPTAPMLALSEAATHAVGSTHPPVEEAAEGQCGAIEKKGEHQLRDKGAESAQHRHSVVQRLLIHVLRKAEQYPQASLASVLLRISDALPPAVAARDVQFQQQVQPLLVQLCARSPDVQKCLTRNGAMWLRRCTEQATQTINECLAEQERRFRQFELEEATLRREEVEAAQAAVAAERLRHANEAKRTAELGQQRVVKRSTAASEVSQSGSDGGVVSLPMRKPTTTVSHHSDHGSSAVAATRRDLRQQQLFPDLSLAHLAVKRERTPPVDGADMRSPKSVPPRPADNGSSAMTALNVDSDEEDVMVAASTVQLLGSFARPASPCAVTPPSPASAPAPLAKAPKTSPSTTASTTARAAPTRLQHKLQEINARNTHRVHHAEQLRQLQERLRRVAISTNLLHLQPPLVHDIVGPASQCMAPEVPVLPEVFVSASDGFRRVSFDGSAASAGGASLNASATMPFGDAASEYAVRFAPHIALELRYDIIRNYEDFLDDVCKGHDGRDTNSSHYYRHSAATAPVTAGEGASPSPVNGLWNSLLPLHPGIPPACVAVQSSCAASRGHSGEAVPGPQTLHFDVRACANPAVDVYLQRQQQRAQDTHSSAQRSSTTSTTMHPKSVHAVVVAAAQQGLSAAFSEGDVVAVLLPLQTILAKWAERELRRPLSDFPVAELEHRVLEMLDTLPRSWRTLGCAVQVCEVQSLSPGGRAAHLCATPSVVEQSSGGHGPPSLRFSHVFRMAYDTTSSPTFYVTKLTSVNASLMELEALHKIDRTRFAATLYDPRSTAPVGVAFCGWANSLLSTAGPSCTVPLLDQLRARLLLQQQLNDWQARAIVAVLYAACPGWDDGVAEQSTRAPVPRAPEMLVIEGPPGTGKTQTIGLLTLNLLHHLSRTWGTARRILVCAPSNCGVDEALLRVVRLREQLRGAAPGGALPPAHAVLAGGLLRIGVRDRVDREVLRLQEPVFFDDVVERHLSGTPATAESLRRGERAGGSRDSASPRGHNAGGNGTASGRAAVRSAIRTHTLESAAIVFSTLGSLHHIGRQVQGIAFDVVIVDEASQGTEPAVLQAVALAKSKSVLVGDSRQLQPTVLSWEASRCGLRRSLLVRLLACGHPSFLLRTQYRMHPDIAAFPNEYFYGSKLLTDRSVLARSRAPDSPTAAPATIAQQLGRCPRFVFVDVRDSPMERRRGRSLLNRREATAVVDCMRQLRAFFKMTVREMAAHVGIITFYTAQRETILSTLTQEERHSGVQVATVDSFQGKEKRIILLSCVRTLSAAQLQRRAAQGEKERNSDDSDGVAREERSANRRLGRYGLGFLADWHRLNVALTRAQDLCVCFASRDTVRAVGMAAMASAAPANAVTTVDSSAEEVEHQLDADDEDPLALYRMLAHAETRDPTLQPPASEPVLLEASTDSVEIVDAPGASRSRAACLTYRCKAHLVSELTARAGAAQARDDLRSAQ
ncbi:ATP-dependent helicase [Leishmania donovani]|nr:ATP-dependent helicase [Leishmania donovani]